MAKKKANDALGQFSAETGFLSNAHNAVREQFKATTDLPTFLRSVGDLSLRDRRLLVDQAKLLLEENYVHLPLKEAMHGINPVQRCRLLQHKLSLQSAETMDSEFAFHRELLEIFNSARDLHTNYLLPEPFSQVAAFLPFDIEECFIAGKPHYFATHFMEGFTHDHFKPGAEIILWNGMPMERAIEVSAAQHAGSNEPARWVRGIEGLTKRALRASLPPNALWALLNYKDTEGKERELKQGWLVTPLPQAKGDAEPAEGDMSVFASAQGVDIEQDILRRLKQMLYAPQTMEAKKRRTRSSSTADDDIIEIAPPLRSVLRAKRIKTASGEFGYIRIYTFSVKTPMAFVAEFVRILKLLPQEGLVLDVRGNGGGHIWASEGLLQLLTPSNIQPEPVQFINSALNLKICERHEDNPVGIDLGDWVSSMQQSVKTGSIYSASYSITPADFANSLGQQYSGGVVLITDARCYSATDIFAAGFQDHNIGPILGVDGNTGAGGANVWTHNLLKLLLENPPPADKQSPYKTLPKGAGLRVSIRRTLRVGELSGTPLEDLGVVPDERYYMTKDDLFKGNKDLLNVAGKMLKELPVRKMVASLRKSSDGKKHVIKLDSGNFTHLDIFINNRPRRSYHIKDGRHNYRLSAKERDKEIRLLGYEDGELVVARKLFVGS